MFLKKTIMKNLLFVFALSIMTLTVQAQETETKDPEQEKNTRMLELMTQKIEMDVDTSLFLNASLNTYVSESPKAVIVAMMVPESYETTRQKMNENVDPAFQVSDKGETEINGVKVLFMKGTSAAEGDVLDSQMYCMAVDDETCMMFIGLAEQGIDVKYNEAITKALNSVVKKK